VQDRILAIEEFSGHDWMLGQGTIYPDTIESGGTANAAVIKTHHNRVERIAELIAQGRVLEPLAEFYKDEVRALGRVLGLPPPLIERHPFPGPGLAIRCLCSGRVERPEADGEIDGVAKQAGYRAFLLPLRSVGVQGDSRSYAKLTVLHGGGVEYTKLLPLSTAITNQYRRTNRVVAALSPAKLRPADWSIKRATLTPKRVALLQEADRIVTEFLRSEKLYRKVWQCPVVLLPFGSKGGETIALRPITSIDGMTAEVARLPVAKLEALAKRLRAVPGIEAVFLDISHKPPSTIEWE
jgi:GMP synthase (glutamine-hydrolysing)